MSLNIKVFVDGEEVNVPQSSTEDTLDIINSEDRKQAVIEWLERINEKFFTWRFNRDAIERLSGAEKELFDKVVNHPRLKSGACEDPQAKRVQRDKTVD